ncbi:MAG: flagellar basal body P-ring formation protein FlgA [Acidobacteriaceae bacterium]|nr:flagellar basal body P-ring formation protein FlgA [Acidobacteriaceae bacterium]
MLVVLLAVLMQPVACHSIASDWIQGSDLADALPAFSGLLADTKISPAPFPGQVRIFHPAELRRLAIANRLNAEITGDICFSWKLNALSPDVLEAAMKSTLAGREPQVEILEQSLAPVPEGTVVFPYSGLGSNSPSGALWRGYVAYAGSRRFPIWARVRITIAEKRVIAASAVHFGDALKSEQLREQVYTGAPPREECVSDMSKIAGMTARRDIAAGTPICAWMLEPPREVVRGDTVSVIAQSGAAVIEAQGVAEQDGRRGDIITLRNPRSGKTFRGRVEKKDVVAVVPGGFFGLVAEGKS